MSAISYAFPDLDELFAMADKYRNPDNVDRDDNIKAAARDNLKTCDPVESRLVIIMGANGVILASKFEMEPIIFQHFEAESTHAEMYKRVALWFRTSEAEGA